MTRNLKKILVLTLVAFVCGVGPAYAVPNLDYYTGNPADSVYQDTGAEYVYLTDLTAPASTPTMRIGIDSILSTYQHDYILGIFDISGNSLNVLDTYAGITSENVVFDLGAGSASTTAGGTTSLMNTTFGYYLRFYTDIGSGILSAEAYYSNADPLDQYFGFFYDFNGIGSLGFAETGVALGGPSTQGHAMIAVHDVKPVPEPGTLILLGCGMLGLVGFGRRMAKM